MKPLQYQTNMMAMHMEGHINFMGTKANPRRELVLPIRQVTNKWEIDSLEMRSGNKFYFPTETMRMVAEV